MTTIINIDSIGEKYGDKLCRCGISTLRKLREKGATPSGRKAISQITGIDEALVQAWVIRANLIRVKGVGSQYADLLSWAGVQSIGALAKSHAGVLYTQMALANHSKMLVKQFPPYHTVMEWIQNAHVLHTRSVPSERPLAARLASELPAGSEAAHIHMNKRPVGSIRRVQT